MFQIFSSVSVLFYAIIGAVVGFLIIYIRNGKTVLQDRASQDYFKAASTQVTPNIQDEESVEGKVAIVTGANCGIGRAVALELAKRGTTVIMGCRDMAKSQKALKEMQTRLDLKNRENLILMKLDLGNFDSIKTFITNFRLRFSFVQILINNAGVFDRNGKLNPTTEGFEPHMGINHLGHFYLTTLLLESLKKGAPSRVVTVTSYFYAHADMNVENLPDILSQVQRGTPGDMRNYANSKYANILFSKELGSRLVGTKVNTYAVCPGIVQTRMLRHENWWTRHFLNTFIRVLGIPPEEGVQTILMCALSQNLAEETAELYRFGAKWTCLVKDIDSKLMKKLWDQSESIIRNC